MVGVTLKHRSSVWRFGHEDAKRSHVDSRIEAKRTGGGSRRAALYTFDGAYFGHCGCRKCCLSREEEAVLSLDADEQ